MKTIVLIVMLLGAQKLIATSAEKPRDLPIAKLTVKTIDEQAKPAVGVQIHFVFMEPFTHQPLLIDGVSDEGGFFSAEGGSDSTIAGEIRKAGYYRGGFPLEPFRESKDGRWQPWNQTNIALMRKIENPIPMYARIAVITVPVQNKSCGYDLKEGDLVSPWGKGVVADFVFTAESLYTNRNSYRASMKLTFSNTLDGIQPANLPSDYAHSDFIWHRKAPETGYNSGYEQQKRTPKMHYLIPSIPGIHRTEDIQNQKFYFRVRTVEEGGKIVSALYGKLAAGFEMLIPNDKELKIVLIYYLNPKPLDRNMEFDLKKNLFKNLKIEEQPRSP